jgi:hypothetical protein
MIMLKVAYTSSGAEGPACAAASAFMSIWY